MSKNRQGLTPTDFAEAETLATNPDDVCFWYNSETDQWEAYEMTERGTPICVRQAITGEWC